MNARFATIRRHASKIGAVAAVTALSASSAFAADDAFTTAAADIGTKIGTYGAALVGLAAAGIVFKVAIKYVKKIASAA